LVALFYYVPEAAFSTAMYAAVILIIATGAMIAYCRDIAAWQRAGRGYRRLAVAPVRARRPLDPGRGTS
jgi:hypothetical protein